MASPSTASSRSDVEEGLMEETKSNVTYHDEESPSRLHSLDLDEDDHVPRSRIPDFGRYNPFGRNSDWASQPESRLVRNSRNPLAIIGSSTFAWALACIILVLAGAREYQHHSQGSQIQQPERSDFLSTTPGSEDLPNSQNVAYVTFMTESVKKGKGEYSYEEDHYLISMRMLIYQLKHQPETRTRRSIPLIVMVTEDVDEHKRKLLQQDGATILPVEKINDGSDWMGKTNAQWSDQLTKLRAWELTQYDRILYLDSDIILFRSLDGVFDEVTYNNTVVPTLQNPKAVKKDEAELPEDYLMASSVELWAPYAYPPTHKNIDDPKGKYRTGTNYINGGFMLFKPSVKILEYYRSLARVKNKFNPLLREQALLNYAHRRSGNMPSMILPMTWNQISVTKEAVAGKVASIHDKYYRTRSQYPGVLKYSKFIRWRMEAFFELRANYLHSTFNGTKELDGVSLDYTL